MLSNFLNGTQAIVFKWWICPQDCVEMCSEYIELRYELYSAKSVLSVDSPICTDAILIDYSVSVQYFSCVRIFSTNLFIYEGSGADMGGEGNAHLWTTTEVLNFINLSEYNAWPRLSKNLPYKMKEILDLHRSEMLRTGTKIIIGMIKLYTTLVSDEENVWRVYGLLPLRNRKSLLSALKFCFL